MFLFYSDAILSSLCQSFFLVFFFSLVDACVLLVCISHYSFKHSNPLYLSCYLFTLMQYFLFYDSSPSCSSFFLSFLFPKPSFIAFHLIYFSVVSSSPSSSLLCCLFFPSQSPFLPRLSFPAFFPLTLLPSCTKSFYFLSLAFLLLYFLSLLPFLLPLSFTLFCCE